MFTVKRPTPTTVLYTVSSRSPDTTWTARARTFTLLLARFIAGTIVALLLWAKYRQWTNTSSSKIIFSASPIEQLAISASSRVQWLYFLPLGAVVIWLVFRKDYIEESLLVIRGLGVQSSTSSPTHLSTATTRFIPTSSIQDIFIHEAFKGFEVLYYLSIVVEGESDVVVVFPTILPKRQVLEDVWRGTRACLYEPKA